MTHPSSLPRLLACLHRQTTGGVEHGGDGDEAREQRPKHKKRRFGLGKKKESYSHTHYKVYKRRWIGLGQLVLLNIVVSWDVS